MAIEKKNINYFFFFSLLWPVQDVLFKCLTCLKLNIKRTDVL